MHPSSSTISRPGRNGSYKSEDGYSDSVVSGTLPLSINRPPRPVTPSSSSPLRPTRSSMRPRQISQHSSTSMDIQRDSIDTQSSRPRPKRSEDSDVSSVAMAAIAGFQDAGRKRALAVGKSDRDKERATELQEERRRQRKIQERAPGRTTDWRKKPAGDIDAVLDQVKDDWSFVVDPDFNPVDLALQLMGDSVTNRDFDEFADAEAMLSRALKDSVDNYFHAFASAVPHHSALLNRLGAIQDRVRDLRSILQEAKYSLGNKRSDLVQLWSRNQILEEMLKLLDQIEHLKAVPESLESLMVEKHLYQAVSLLVQSAKQINTQEMLDIGAMADLRIYFTSQENGLKEILIDELHNRLYLKMMHYRPNWAPDRFERNNGMYLDNEDDMSDTSSIGSVTMSAYILESNYLVRGLGNSGLYIRTDEPLDASQPRPTEETTPYIEAILESLSLMGRLGEGLDVVAQRLPNEIYSLVEKTIEEVSERAGLNEKGHNSSSKAIRSQNSNSDAFIPELFGSQTESDVVRDLFHTLYAKLGYVVRGLRAIYEVASRVGNQRRDRKDSSIIMQSTLFPLSEVWSSIQIEIRRLLNDYLVDKRDGESSGRREIASVSEVTRDTRLMRDRTKNVFRLADAMSRFPSKSLRQQEDDLTQTLKETVPGLVYGVSDVTLHVSSSNSNEDRSSEGHIILVKPNVFHVQILYGPTLAFLNHVAEELPSGGEFSRTSETILEEFFSDMYFPQLEEKTLEIFDDIINESDAFDLDIDSSQSLNYSIKAVTRVVGLVKSLCLMMKAVPAHQDNYARIILGLVIQFYQQCSDRVQHLTTSMSKALAESAPRPVLSLRWAQNMEVTFCLSELKEAVSDNPADRDALCRRENEIELRLLGEQDILDDQLISPMRRISSLSSLYRSLTWLVDCLDSIKEVANEDSSASSPQAYRLNDSSIGKWSDSSLSLSGEMELRFDSLLRTYGQLSELILFTLRLDIRCRTIRSIHSAMLSGNYHLDQEAMEPEWHIMNLCTELEKCDEYTRFTLKPTDRLFLFEGLEPLMESLLISGSSMIKAANGYGVKKMIRNISALRQSFIALTGADTFQLRRAIIFYNLFFLGPAKLLEQIRKERQFTFDEYKGLISLQCSVGHRTIGQSPGDKEYSMYIIELHGIELEYSSEK